MYCVIGKESKGMKVMKLKVAIDGPAGAGKSTIAKLIANELDLMYINTGAMYRAVTFKALENNIKPSETEKLANIIDEMDMYFINNELYLNGENIDSTLTLPNISKNVSNYAAIKEVREKLVENMRKISEKYDVIMDGRDIGTVVLKDSKHKFFLSATAEERAMRRYNELKKRDVKTSYEDILMAIKERDYLDENREIDPLVKADDAIEIDSTNLTISEVVSFIVNRIRQ